MLLDMLFFDVENPVFVFDEGRLDEAVYQNPAAVRWQELEDSSLEEVRKRGRLSESRFSLEGIGYVRYLVLMEQETEAKTLDYLAHNVALRKILDQSNSYLLLMECAGGRILFGNRPLLEATGLTNDKIRKKTGGEVMDQLWGAKMSENRKLLPFFQEGKEKETDEAGKYRMKELEFRHPISEKWFFIRGGLIHWVDQKEVYLLAVQDITERKSKEEKLQIEAMTDSMTGIGNRELGRRMIERILLDKDSKQVNTLVFIDVDQLKTVNDRFGHEAGDWLIHKVVDTIRSHIRKSDIFCRWGGDEFILVIRADEEQTGKIMDKIHSLLEQFNKEGESKFDVSFSYGTTEIPHNSQISVEELVSQADSSMYRYKNSQKEEQGILRRMP
jgi:diguanylate cyclase (GGDEF)-like protein/PAS domain S-box-containing protein